MKLCLLNGLITKSNTEVIILKQFLTRGSTQSVQKISPRKFMSSLKLYYLPFEENR